MCHINLESDFNSKSVVDWVELMKISWNFYVFFSGNIRRANSHFELKLYKKKLLDKIQLQGQFLINHYWECQNRHCFVSILLLHLLGVLNPIPHDVLRSQIQSKPHIKGKWQRCQIGTHLKEIGLMNTKEIGLKEMTRQTIGGLFSTLHLVTCMESNNWLMKWCLFKCVCRWIMLLYVVCCFQFKKIAV